MIQIMIVDDEPWLIKGLQSIINWKEHGFEITSTATNGIDALKLISENQPDVVLLDINMPQLSGLEALKIIRQEHPEVSVVMISGYAEFAYVQKALRFGATDYILKPVDEDDLLRVLEKISSSKQDKFNETAWNEKIVQKRITNDLSQLRSTISEKLHLTDSTDVIVGFSECGGEFVENSSENNIVAHIAISENEHIFFVNSDAFTGIEEIGKHLYLKCKARVGLCSLSSNFNNFSQCYSTARLTLNKFWEDLGNYNIEPSQSYENLSKEISKLFSLLSNGNLPAFKIECTALISSALSGTINYQSRIDIYNNIISCLKESGITLDDFFLPSISIQNVFNNVYCFTYPQLMQQLAEEINNLSVVSNSSFKTSSAKSTLSKSAINYIDSHFTDKNLSVNTVAQILHVNTAYLGQTFKLCNNMSVLEYITLKRMDYAERLLLSETLSIEEISEKVGISDYFYFNKLYKKHKGEPPGKTRKK